MVNHLASGREQVEDADLARHAAECPRCARKLKRYAAVRDAVRALTTQPVTPEISEACGEGIERFAARPGRRRVPADPKPTVGRALQALVTAASLGGIAIALTAAMILLPGDHEPPPSVGRIAGMSGTVKVRRAGSSVSMQADATMPLPAGTLLETGADGLVSVETAAGGLHLGSTTVARLTDERCVDLGLGRLALCTGGATAGAAKLTCRAGANGSLTCESAEVLARATLRRLIVRCVSGSACLDDGAEGVEIKAGDQAMLLDGKLCEPIRAAGAITRAHWRRELDLAAAGLCTPAVAATLPLPHARSLPAHMEVGDLSVDLSTRGPLYLVVLRAQLLNAGDAPWRGALDPARVLWPEPICVAPSDPVEIAPGQSAAVECAALGAMGSWGERFVWSMPLEGWTASPIAALSARLDIQAAGGLRRPTSPTHEIVWERSGRAYSGRLEQDRMSPRLPVKLVFQFSRSEGQDVLALPVAEQADRHALLAVRGLFGQSDDVLRAERLLLAFDATADHGPLDRVYAHEVVEALTAGFDTRAELPVLAYDGRMRTLPPGVDADERMASLWALSAAASEPSDALLQALARGRSEKPTLAFLIAGARSIGVERVSEPFDRAAAGDLAPYIVQVGAAGPAPIHRLCNSVLGGSTTAADGSLSAEGFAQRMRMNLPWPSIDDVSYALSGGTLRHRVQARRDDSANGPVLIAAALAGGRIGGEMTAAAADEKLTRLIDAPAPSSIPLSAPLAARLNAALASLVQGGSAADEP